jgi:ribosomal protein S21
MRSINVSVEKPKKGKRESFESLLRRFKKSVKEAGIMEAHKSKQYYEKPSKVKRDKKLKHR